MEEKPMSNRETIDSTEEAWDSGELGATEEFAVVAVDDVQAMTDQHLDLQPISIRLEKSLIEDFKLIASIHGVGYQPLMRQILKRFADSEKKQILREAASNMELMRKEEGRKARPTAPKQKKAA
jgi:hypothetical protein